MSEVELIAKMVNVNGAEDETLVVNSARISFGKRVYEMRERDGKLIRFLATHGHWTPFGHPHVTLYVRAPVFVARQLGKHQVGFVWNEISRRYVDFDPEFFHLAWRERAANKKQGSAGYMHGPRAWVADRIAGVAVALSAWAYDRLLKLNVAPEQARAVLPQTMYTEWFWTGSLYGWSRVVRLRVHEDAQQETQDVCRQVDVILRRLYPVSWPELVDGE